ncbi:MAG: PAS domain S-box protein [bacterium]|nr:PAS domain S-box protein [bacterium]
MFNYTKVKELRKSKKIQLKKMAELMGISKITLYRWETGVRVPSNNDIRVIALFLGVSVKDISDLTEITEIKRNINLDAEVILDRSIYKLEKLIKELEDVPSIDISALRHIKQACFEYQKTNTYLDKTVHRYEQILDQNSSIVYVLDTNFKFRYVNRAFLLMSNKFSTDDVVGYTGSDVFGLNNIYDILQYEKTVFSEFRPIYNKKVTIPCSNGSKSGLLTIYPRIGKNGKIIEIICSIQDITEVLNLVNQLQNLKNVIDLTDDAIVIQNQNSTKYEYVSKSMEKLSGYKQEVFYRNSNFWFSIIHPEDMNIPPTDEHIPFNRKGRYKYRIIRKDDSIIWVESRIYMEKVKETGQIYRFAVIRNITDQVRK